ncbi:MAG: tetratricopeptide repeat protein [Bryobacteraceae bacterium]
MRTCLLFVLLAGLSIMPAAAQMGPDPGEAAYGALRAGELDRAVALFRQAIVARPEAAHLRKDYAYALLKTGEREQARDQFAEALRIDPNDEQSALEDGFLCYETKQPVQARRIFLRWKELGSQQTRATAAAAFESIDRPLREGIERWKAAVAAAPDQWTAHEELARLAEQRDELALAAEQYQKAWQLRPAERRLMIDLARVLKEQGKLRETMALLVAASRSPAPRVAEMARELMPARYPYPYEFEDALQADPENRNLRREYAFLLLAMDKNAEARRQLEIQVRQHPEDRVSSEQLRVLNEPPKPPQPPAAGLVVARPAGQGPGAISAKEMGMKSYQRGYLQDAQRYLRAAWEQSPGDAEVALELGWTLNLLRRDGEALAWFDRARRSGTPETAREAERAYHNLRASRRAVRMTVWALPMYSSRWGSMFMYSQAKLDIVRWKKWGLQPYLSLRWVGDTKTCSTLVDCKGGPGPMLSDSAVIAGAGANRYITPHLFVWGEAGRAFSYAGNNLVLNNNPAAGRGQPDYRGGAAYLRGWGAAANNGESGWFSEAGADGVYVSRYDHNSLLYTQLRRGYTLPELPGGLRVQPLWNLNWTVDARRQWWGNYAETGPGVRFRWAGLPPSLSFRTDFLRGAYLVNQDNPHPRKYWDARASLWYAITR